MQINDDDDDDDDLQFDLYACLVELGDARQLVAHVDVRVVALGERRLELLQLFLRERGPVSAARRRRAAAVMRRAAGARCRRRGCCGCRQHYR